MTIRDLVGDEYSLVSFRSWMEKAEIRHNACGKINSYLPDNFTKGSRCPYCHLILRNEQLRHMLIEASDEAYDITRFGKSSCDVKDVTTGKRISLTSHRIKQELFRPTPSPILPKLKKDSKHFTRACSWDIAFALYKQYIHEFADLPRQGDLYEGFDLGLWCQHQRDDYRKGKLTDVRLRLLQDIGFDWDPLETAWWDKFETYRRHAQAVGVYVKSDTVYEGKTIGRWVISQRDANKVGKLSEERKKLLLSVDPDFFAVRKS